MRGFRQEGILVAMLTTALIIAMLMLSGCGGSCPPTKSYEQRPITDTVELYSEEPYTVEEIKVVGEKCIEKEYGEFSTSQANFKLSMSNKEWIGKPTIPNQTNQVRRIATIFNGGDELDSVYLDKIYLYNGTEIKRSKHPMMFRVDPQTSRNLYVVWDTQFDPLKDITMDFTNNSAELGVETTTMRLCYNETEKYNTTKYKKVLTGTKEELKGYDNVVKVKLNRKC
jgi:hypothetical protein